MGFDLQRMSLRQRASVTAPRDEIIQNACKVCKFRDLCGGFWIWDDSRWCDQNCADCPVACCQKPFFFTDADRLGGLQFDDIHWKPWSIDWPDLTWVVGGRAGDLPEPVYMIPVDSLVNRHNLRWAKTVNLRERFSIPRESKLGITFCFQDWMLDRFRGREDEICDHVAGYEIDFVLPINFSTYRNFPRLDQLISMRRRMLSLKAFQDRGLRVIPDIGMTRPVDADRWAEWVLREKCDTVFVTVQTIRGKKTNTRYHLQVENLTRFRDRVGPDVRILLQGPSARGMPFFRSKLGKVSFVNHAAWVKAELKIHAVTGMRLRDRGFSAQAAFRLNTEALKGMLPGSQSAGG
jgi:hypothetical protein